MQKQHIICDPNYKQWKLNKKHIPVSITTTQKHWQRYCWQMTTMKKSTSILFQTPVSGKNVAIFGFLKYKHNITSTL